MLRWLIALTFLAAGSVAHAADPFPISDSERAVGGHTQWLNTSRALTPDDLRGRILLLDFWTLGCVNCMDIIPDLKSLEQEFGGNITVIGVHSAKFAGEKDTDAIRAAILRYGLTHPVVNDADFTTWSALGVRAWPTLVLIGPDGKTASVYAGEGNRAAIEADIKTLLEKYKDRIVTAPLPIALESAKEAQSQWRFPGKVIVADMAGPQKKSYPALYVADSGHNRVVMADLAGNIVASAGDGRAGNRDGNLMTAQFFKPQGMAAGGGQIYVADLGNHELRLVNFNAGTVTTLAGNGTQGHFLEDTIAHDATKTALSSPWDVTFWPDADHLVIAMTGAHQLWSYDTNRRTVTLLAGNGQEGMDDGRYPFASLAQPSGLFAGTDGKLYFVDAESSALRVFDADGTVTTLIGKGLFDFGYKEGGKDAALLQHPLGLTGNAESLFIADTYNHSIRRYDIKTASLHDFAGHDARGTEDGALAAASFDSPGGLALSGGTLYVADTNNNALRAIDINAAKVMTPGATVPAAAAPAIAPATPAAAPAPAASAPNLTKLSFSVAAGVPVDVNLSLKDGWHINDQAPSELSFMSGPDPLFSFSRDMLKTLHVMLPKLKEDGKYRLTGQIFYCADTAGSLCMIKSFDITLTPGGKNSAITLPVN
jgi:thiol-disulfide isomerase/thioredoxin/DNA-binding beta-propeller fold protein YncE